MRQQTGNERKDGKRLLEKDEEAKRRNIRTEKKPKNV